MTKKEEFYNNFCEKFISTNKKLMLYVVLLMIGGSINMFDKVLGWHLLPAQSSWLYHVISITTNIAFLVLLYMCFVGYKLYKYMKKEEMNLVKRGSFDFFKKDYL